MMFRQLHLFMLITFCLLLLCGCGKSQDEKETFVYLSPKALAAKYYIDHELPEDQKQAFYTGHGDIANLYANLIDSGHLDGAAEYAEAILKQSGDNN